MTVCAGVSLEQDISPLKVVGLARREMESLWGCPAHRPWRESSCSTHPGRVRGPAFANPPFAPALCWSARTMVASIIAYSLSASCAEASSTRCHTSLRLLREWRVRTPRKSPRRSRRSRHGTPARWLYNTASTNSRLPFAVAPGRPLSPGNRSLMRAHWASCRAHLVLTAQRWGSGWHFQSWGID
jgi:hypothetical protein